MVELSSFDSEKVVSAFHSKGKMSLVILFERLHFPRKAQLLYFKKRCSSDNYSKLIIGDSHTDESKFLLPKLSDRMELGTFPLFWGNV